MSDTSNSKLTNNDIIKKIEDSYDLVAYELAMKEFKEDNTTYSLDEVAEELGIEL